MKNLKVMLTSFFVLVMSVQTSLAQDLSPNEMNFAFGSEFGLDSQDKQVTTAIPKLLSNAEMASTEGDFWPVVYGAAALGTRAFMWAAPRVSSSFRTINNTRSNHTLTVNRNTGCHVCQVGRDSNGWHVGWGAGGRNGSGARHHIYQNSPWRINPF